MRPKHVIPSPLVLVRQTTEMEARPSKVVEPMVKVESDQPTPITVKKPRKKRNYSEWYTHVNKFKAEHPGMLHSQAIREAKKTYTKATKVKRDTSKFKPNPWILHIRKYMDNNKEWCESHSYKETLQKCKETYKKSN